ncbi:hypothetical protein Golob_019487 [Gossypium lobatum]|uniref:AP2/ERF domain-containing protein n=1 Tax=Gossypium lobatum TaxID=34289 RepID=A0A7J8L7E8_9ROSI|nr:hypothetical protein [Gossypium lobatum]
MLLLDKACQHSSASRLDASSHFSFYILTDANAAIKVDKKQIHLGTVGSQEEAARLYDRAAFMCGREPNFELPEEEKQELSRFKWDEFLAYTRRSITNKKYKQRLGVEPQKRSEPVIENSDLDSKRGADSSSASEEVGPDT